MERYSEYKDSGVKWLGEIPSHWEVKRLGSFFFERKEKVSDKDYAPLSVTKQGIFPQLENVAKTNDGDNRKLVKEGDFVINSRSDRKGSSGVSGLDGSVSLINIVLQPRKVLFGPFCNYLLKSYGFIEENYRNGRGIVADLWTTRYDEMKMIKVAMPSFEEQKNISSYLDAATSKIDKAIAMQQKMIDLLNERKQIIIQNAVTKGLDDKVEMKDSGVEWIGMIPKHWRKDKAMRLFGLYGSGTTPRENSNGGNFPWINSGDLNNSNLTVSSKFVSEKMIKDIPALKVYPQNSIIIAMYGASIGKIAISRIKCCTNQACFVLSFPCNKIQLEYAFYSLMACKVKWIEQSQGGTQPNINADIIKQTWLAFPLIEEQGKIVSYIQEKCNDIEKASDRCQRQITLLQERKQIIINEVVTGKVKVS
jgi:type I restriction enzyme S subunit